MQARASIVFLLNCIQGGFFHFYAEDGSVFDRSTRVLVTEARFVFSFAEAYLQLGDENAHLDKLGLRSFPPVEI